MVLKAVEGNVDLVRLLLISQGEKMDCDCRTMDLKTPLILACERGHISVVETLLDLGARIDLRDVRF
jgi:ankyrin repeat protein